VALLYCDNRFLEHETGPHPENAGRLTAIADRLNSSGLLDKCVRPAWSAVEREQIERVHEPDYVTQLESLARRGGGMPDSDTIVSPRSFDVALLAAGAACDAVDRVLRSEGKTALCLVRPPGHHALPHAAMGFCLLNNVAIAARAAIAEHALDRVLIVDWDVHHGNGTQDVFWTDAQVGFFSIHRYPFYPGTGSADETGSGPGLGNTVNLPMKFGLSRAEYHSRFMAELEKFADRLRPQLVLISAGFDAHRLDPIGSLGLEAEDFAVLTRTVQEIARTHCGGRVVSLLEGGYHPAMLAQSVESHLASLLQGEH
jgi:acetoin utilization deacetylase AcuC-like enzyme